MTTTILLLAFALSGTESGPTVETTLPATVIVATVSPRAHALPENASTWHCEAPRPLATDYHQTVKVCAK